jgi:hypothetical protein
MLYNIQLCSRFHMLKNTRFLYSKATKHSTKSRQKHCTRNIQRATQQNKIQLIFKPRLERSAIAELCKKKPLVAKYFMQELYLQRSLQTDWNYDINWIKTRSIEVVSVFVHLFFLRQFIFIINCAIDQTV